VAPLVNSRRPGPTPSRRQARRRAASSIALAFRPVAWLLLGLPKRSRMASSAAAMAAGKTADVALASR